MEFTENGDPEDSKRGKPNWLAKEEVLGDLRSIRRFWRFVLSRFQDDKCMRMAASLSYTTLLAIVPLSAIAFSMLAAFPVFEGVRGEFQEAIFSNFLPQSAQAMRDYFDQFVKNTAGLTAVGIVGLALTAILLLSTIESALNTIFRVTRPRPLLPRLLVFWALITLGPLLIGASFSLSTYFFAVTEFIGVDEATKPIGGITQFLPSVLLIMALVVTYLVIPNRPVDVRGAIIGGIAAGLLFAGLRKVFGLYIASFPTYQTIYGAVSVIPIVLIWTYLSWVVVLVGAVFTAAYGDWRASGGRPTGRNIKPERRLLVALEVLDLIFQQSTQGGAVPRKALLKQTGVGEEVITNLLDDLRDAKIVERTSRDGWLMARDISGLSLHDIFEALHLGIGSDYLLDQTDGWRGRLADRVRQLKAAQEREATIPLRDLLAADNKVEFKKAAIGD